MRTSSYRTRTNDDILFYAGISVAVFDKLVSGLKTQDKTVRKLLTIEDQLLLTLMRLRLGLLCGDLARRFEVAVPYVSRTFSRVLDDLVKIMQEIVLWLPRSKLRANMPESFRNSQYSRTTCIFDCTEALMQRPRKLMAKSQSYSQCKVANTMKFLTVIARNGFIMFVSDVYGGRASDKYIVKTCAVEEYLLPGDEIMADRGLKLDPYLEAQGIKGNRPTFTKGSSLRCSAVVRQLMSLTVPEDSVEEVLDFVKNAILDAMSAENTRQSTRSSSGRAPEDEALERCAAAAFRTAAFQAAGVEEPEDVASPMSLVALMRLIQEELVTDAESLYRPASSRLLKDV
ncbi:uncharacterized protein LOC142578529 [Dermacentor variabilis]|uniref:uncharacterized protein LOC142578529 n=1 Tax=Dermacentor variabilis TaxID=34621 RepID=UPI003F5AF03A